MILYVPYPPRAPRRVAKSYRKWKAKEEKI
jgi:hypothetical protein